MGFAAAVRRAGRVHDSHGEPGPLASDSETHFLTIVRRPLRDGLTCCAASARGLRARERMQRVRRGRELRGAACGRSLQRAARLCRPRCATPHATRTPTARRWGRCIAASRACAARPRWRARAARRALRPSARRASTCARRGRRRLRDRDLRRRPRVPRAARAQRALRRGLVRPIRTWPSAAAASRSWSAVATRRPATTTTRPPRRAGRAARPTTCARTASRPGSRSIATAARS